MAAAIDDSCRRPGSVPFKWEICPGTPKHVRSSNASLPLPPPPFSSNSKAGAVTPKLTPPPSMAPSSYHSPRYAHAYASARAASASPSRVASRGRPTAFIDVAPRPDVIVYRRAGPGQHVDDDGEEETAVAAAYLCFPLPVFRRRDRDGRKGGGSASAGSSFRSVPGGLRRSASSSSSSCLSLSSGSSNKFAEPREVDAAGGWFF